jgi:fructokinase
MASPRVLCIGEILFDFLADQVGLPYGSVQSWTPYVGGAPFNVAAALTKLGTSSGFVGCIGQDDIGDMLIKALEDLGIARDGVQRHASAPTRGVYVVRSPGGERHFAGFGTVDTKDFADTRLDASQLPVPWFAAADFLVLGTLELAYPDSRTALYQALDLADQHRVSVVLDVNWRPVFWPDPTIAPSTIHEILHRADFIKLSIEEADWLFGCTDPAAIAQQIETVQGVLITAGEKGGAYWLNHHEGTIPVFPVTVVDTNGAGDSFVAGFLHQLCAQGGANLENPKVAQEIVTYASAVGALTTTRAGAIAAQPTATQVDEFLHGNRN